MDLPNIILEKKLMYKIGVHKVYIKAERSSVTLENNELLFLNSNLVDRSANNPQQSIVQFNFTKKGNIQQYNGPDIIFQSLYLYELDNASFTLRDFHGNISAIQIKDIFLQIEIIRDDRYGRF
jgi:hypothetical protein